MLFLDDEPGSRRRSSRSHSRQPVLTGWSRDGNCEIDVRVTPHDPDFLGFQRVAPDGDPKGIVINSTLFPTAFLRSRSFDDFYNLDRRKSISPSALPSKASRLSRSTKGTSPPRGEQSRGQRRSRHGFEGVLRRTSISRLRTQRCESRGPFSSWSLANTLGFRIKKYQFTSLPSITCAFGRAVWAAWSMRDESLKVLPSHRVTPRVLAGRSPSEGTSPSFSVLIPTYRRPRELRYCLDAVLGQTRPPEQVIVIRRDSRRGYGPRPVP